VIFSGKICTHGDLGVSGSSYSGFLVGPYDDLGASHVLSTMATAETCRV
jgi:hypothetical protein